MHRFRIQFLVNNEVVEDIYINTDENLHLMDFETLEYFLVNEGYYNELNEKGKEVIDKFCELNDRGIEPEYRPSLFPNVSIIENYYNGKTIRIVVAKLD